MVRNIGKNINITDNATVSAAVSVGNSSVTVAAANSERIYIAISPLKKNVFVKLQAASVDNVKKGIFIPRGFTYELPVDNIYTGEISVIAESGNADVYVTEY